MYISKLINMHYLLATGLVLLPSFAFAYQIAPVANTKAPTFVTEKSAQLNGAVNPNEMPDTTVLFEWGIAGRDTVYRTAQRGVYGGSQFTDVSDALVGLAPNVQYFYRTVAENSRGKDVGITTYFTTKQIIDPIDPIVIIETNNSTNVTDHTATLRGYIAPHTGTGVHWWFEWGTSQRFENITPRGTWGRDSGVAETTISGLTSGTTYFYRIVAENSQGIVRGVARALTTPGIPPTPPEAPRQQSINSPSSSDGVTRNITTVGGAGASTASNNGFLSVGSGSNGTLPGVGYLPGNIFGSLFGGHKLTQSDSSNSGTNNNTQGGTGVKSNSGSTGVSANNTSQLATAGATTPLGTFWDTLTGKKTAKVNIEKLGPSSVPAHTAVEYRVTYSYRLTDVATNAKLKIILPASIVYIGDNTTNELLLEEGNGGERTYVLPIGRMEGGSTRTISILGMTTSDANGVFPDARARLEYMNTSGAIEVVGAGASSQGTVSSSVSSSSIFPSSFFGWLLYIILITLLIFGVRKGRALYEKRKADILLEEEATRFNSMKNSPIHNDALPV